MIPLLRQMSSPNLHGHSAVQASEHTLPVLLEKLGDTNPKLSSAARDCIMFLSGLKHVDMRSHTHVLLKPVKNLGVWKPILGLLNILQARAHGAGRECMRRVGETAGAVFQDEISDVRPSVVFPRTWCRSWASTGRTGGPEALTWRS